MSVVPLLIPEPPLQLLRSLAKEIGLSEAIVLQQVHYRQMHSEDGWVQRAYTDWARTDFPFWDPRTVQRVFGRLREKGLLRVEEPADGSLDRTLRYRVDYGAVPGRQNADLHDDTLPRRSVHMSNKEKGKKGANAPNAREVEGFADWLEHHCVVTGKRVMATEGTEARKRVAGMYAERRREYPDVDLKLVSLGAMADDKRRERGYTDPESVLRPMAVPKLADRGRAATNGSKHQREVEEALARAPELSEAERAKALASVGL